MVPPGAALASPSTPLIGSVSVTLTLATGPVHLDEDGEHLRHRLALALVQVLHRPVKVVPTRTYEGVAALIARGDAQLAWLPPAVYVRAEPELRLLAAVERSGGAGYRGVLFVPAGSEARNLEELEGKRVAWVDRDSCAGNLFPRLSIRERGLDPDALFAEEQFAGSHGSVVHAVMSGAADAGATHAQLAEDGETLILAGWHPYAGRDGMRPLLVTKPIPSDVLCAAPDLESELFQSVRDALLSLHESYGELLDEFFGGPRLVPAAPDDYDPVRAAVR